MTTTPPLLPAPQPCQIYIKISALESGQLTLPESLFVSSPRPNHRATVPSLSFLVRHPTHGNIIFDLGLARDVTSYEPAMQTHISNRQPTIHRPDTRDSLLKGGLDPAKDVDVVILSHVHWDHIGTPSDFPRAEFVVGSGTLHLLSHGAPPHYPAEIFDPELLPRERTKELPPTDADSSTAVAGSQQTKHTWFPIGPFPHVIDFYGDGSIYIIDAPGHLFGHINLLARSGPGKYVYLGGDCCHDVRILTGEKDIGLYDDGHGGMRSVHVDTEVARGTVGWVQTLMGSGGVSEEDGQGGTREVSVEVVVAHDGGWRERNRERFWPGVL